MPPVNSPGPRPNGPPNQHPKITLRTKPPTSAVPPSPNKPGQASGTSNSKTLDQRNAEVTDHLESRYDALNELFDVAEERLKALRPITEQWVVYDTRGSEGDESWDVIGLTKIDGRWRLAHATDHQQNPSTVLLDVKPIVECPAEVRVRAAREVRNLHEKIVKQKEAFIQSVDNAIADLSKYCTEF